MDALWAGDTNSGSSAQTVVINTDARINLKLVKILHKNKGARDPISICKNKAKTHFF